MRIDAREIGDPVAVIAGRFLARRALHRLVLVYRPEPDRGRAQCLDVIEACDQAFEIAAVIEAFVGRIEAGPQPIALKPPRSLLRSPFSKRSGNRK